MTGAQFVGCNLISPNIFRLPADHQSEDNEIRQVRRTMEEGQGMRSTADKWVDLAYHRAWLINQASDLFAFFERNSRNPEGGFHVLDTRGEPVAGAAGQTRELHATSRMVHSFAIARLMG
ncbi:MAG: hypothetical protein ACTSP2_06185, partial [Alphaproteobacteria bacterium]